MALTIDLHPEKEDLLRNVAARRGLLPEDYAREIVERNLPRIEAAPPKTPAERAAAFREWASSYRNNTAVVLDDSRESIYGDLG